MLITEFFENQDIFITGATGFLGKALLDKLLRLSPNIGNIYVLIRSKKGKSIQERLKALLEAPVFENSRKEQPQNISKVYAIDGDTTKLKLGIGNDDMEKLKNVSIIIHAAATVRFDEPLHSAILQNTQSTYEIIKIAENLKQLKVLMHVSTTFCNSNHTMSDEEVFPACADWRTTIRLAQTYDEDTLEMLSLKYIDPSPNTYTFTKNLAEQIVKEYRDKLPVVIFRPSIVLPALKEPLPGWIDNLNGSIGLLLACSLGILRINFITHSIIYDQVPVDMVVRAMVIACYKKGCLSRDDNNLDVYNLASRDFIRINLKEFLILAEKECKKNPFAKTLWTPGGKPTLCPFIFAIRLIFLQLLLACLGDIGLRLSGQKPLWVQRRIFVANKAIGYFTNRNWIFKNDKALALETIIPKSEIDKFCLTEYLHRDHGKMIATYIRGLKIFLMNEPEEASKGTWRRFKILTYANYLLQFLTVLIAVRFLIYLLF